MKTTANYALREPEGTDVVNIDDLNYNAEVIDSKLKAVETKVGSITVPITSVNNKTGAVTLSASDIKAADGTTLEVVKADLGSHLADNMAHGIGDKTKLNTTAKDTIVAAINEVFQFGTSVKSSTISAVNSKGQGLSTTATWNQIIAAINSIARGQGNAVESQVLSGADFSNSDGKLRHGSMPNNGVVSGTITNQGQSISIPEGYTKGGSIIAKFANLIASNVKKNVDIGGIIGSLDIESLGGRQWTSGNISSQDTGSHRAQIYLPGVSFKPKIILISGRSISTYKIYNFAIYDADNIVLVSGNNWISAQYELDSNLANSGTLTSSNNFATMGGSISDSQIIMPIQNSRYNGSMNWYDIKYGIIG
ncbi:hypothetical protein [Clostridium sp. AWRP]|uniref:hypothetical protein n=1 Tax=Clostridium sp. AWRP TaxID=2212991 RepID=UPI000FD847F8|nr:hypothetical protein [Clostridium sp. AWRP]AZV56808.1 hypothetical protein DMR38_09465 [Clostridium sp. AWRP]